MPPIEGPFPVHLIKIKDFQNVINDDDVCDPYVQLTLGKESQTSEVKVDAGGEVEYNQVSTVGRGGVAVRISGYVLCIQSRRPKHQFVVPRSGGCTDRPSS